MRYIYFFTIASTLVMLFKIRSVVVTHTLLQTLSDCFWQFSDC